MKFAMSEEIFKMYYNFRKDAPGVDGGLADDSMSVFAQNCFFVHREQHSFSIVRFLTNYDVLNCTIFD